MNKYKLLTLKPFVTIFIVIVFIISSCKINKHFNNSENSESSDSTQISNINLNIYSNEDINILKQYLIGNPQWEFRIERGKEFAVKKIYNDGKFIPFQNNYISIQKIENKQVSSRILISFNQTIGLNSLVQTITPTSKEKINLSTLKRNTKFDKTSTYLILKSEKINLEIFEESKNLTHTYTKSAINNLRHELNAVLQYKNEVKKFGRLPLKSYYPIYYDSTFYSIHEGSEPGIYIAEANLVNKIPGFIYIKVFESNHNVKISHKIIETQTTKRIGWAENTATLFYYESDFKILEGSVGKPIDARIEFWFKDLNGNQKKISEIFMQIYSWERLKSN